MAKQLKRSSHGFNLYEARDMMDMDKYVQDQNQILNPELAHERLRRDAQERVWCAELACLVLPKDMTDGPLEVIYEGLGGIYEIDAEMPSDFGRYASASASQAINKQCHFRNIQKPKTLRGALRGLTVVTSMGARGLKA